MKKVISGLLLITLAGCASKAQNITAAYVSPLQYQSYSCTQVGDELGRVSRKVLEVSGQQDSTATKDTVAMSVGLILFWPALFFLPGGDHEVELSRLKGELDALEKIAIDKQCTTVVADIDIAKKRQAESQQAKAEQDTTVNHGLIMENEEKQIEHRQAKVDQTTTVKAEIENPKQETQKAKPVSGPDPFVIKL